MDPPDRPTEVGRDNLNSVSQLLQNQITTMPNEYRHSMPHHLHQTNDGLQNFISDPYDVMMQNPYYGNVPEQLDNRALIHFNNPSNPMYTHNTPIIGQSHAYLPEQYSDRLQERYSIPVEQFPPTCQQPVNAERCFFQTSFPFQNPYDNRIRGQFQNQRFASSLPGHAYSHPMKEQHSKYVRYNVPMSMNESIVNAMGERQSSSSMQQEAHFPQPREIINHAQIERLNNPRMEYNRSIQERSPVEMISAQFPDQSMQYQLQGVDNYSHMPVAIQHINRNLGPYNEPRLYNNLQTTSFSVSPQNRFMNPRLRDNNPIAVSCRGPFSPFGRSSIQRYPALQTGSTFNNLKYSHEPIISRFEPSSFCTNSVLSSTTPTHVFTTTACRPVICSEEKKPNESQMQIVRPTVQIQTPHFGAIHPSVPMQNPNLSTVQIPKLVIGSTAAVGSSKDSKPTEKANISQVQIVSPISTAQQCVSKSVSNTIRDETERTDDLAGKEISDVFFRRKLNQQLQKENSALDFVGRESDRSLGMHQKVPISESSASRLKIKTKVYPPIVGAKVAAVVIPDEVSNSKPESKQENVIQSVPHRYKFLNLTGSTRNPNIISSAQSQQSTTQSIHISSGLNSEQESRLENEKDIIQETVDVVAEKAKNKLEKIHNGCEKLTSSDLLEILEISDEKLAVLELLYLKTITKNSVFLSNDDVEAILSCNTGKQNSPDCGTLHIADVDGCDTQQLQSSSNYPTVTGAHFFVSDNPCSSSPPTKVSANHFLMSQGGVKQYILQRFSQDLAKYGTYYSESESESDSNSASKTYSSGEIDISQFHFTPKNDVFCVLTPGGVYETEEYETTVETSETPDDLHHESVSQNCLQIKRF